MNRIPFFLTSHQRYDAGWGVPKPPLQLGAGSKTGEAVEFIQGHECFHRPIPYLLQPKPVKFSKNFYRLKTAENDPH
jgi:hypothetical protein